MAYMVCDPGVGVWVLAGVPVSGDSHGLGF